MNFWWNILKLCWTYKTFSVQGSWLQNVSCTFPITVVTKNFPHFFKRAARGQYCLQWEPRCSYPLALPWEQEPHSLTLGLPSVEHSAWHVEQVLSPTMEQGYDKSVLLKHKEAWGQSNRGTERRVEASQVFEESFRRRGSGAGWLGWVGMGGHGRGCAIPKQGNKSRKKKTQEPGNMIQNRSTGNS